MVYTLNRKNVVGLDSFKSYSGLWFFQGTLLKDKAQILLNAQTGITKAQPYFIDEQRFGPYKMWHHEHHFFETEKGIKMRNKVTYKIPFGVIGRIAHSFFIKNKLKQIFSYRTKVLEEIF